MNQMQEILPTVLCAILCGLVGARAEKLTIERIYGDPALDGPRPRSVAVAPNGSRVTFLKGKNDDYERLDLWEYNLADGVSRLLVASSGGAMAATWS